MKYLVRCWSIGFRTEREYLFFYGTDLIRSISDPEHPNTLEELRVVSAPQIQVGQNHIKVEFTPTVPHCGMSTLIGELVES
jgi:metal-sulfur cluster biosynthetic enzyme